MATKTPSSRRKRRRLPQRQNSSKISHEVDPNSNAVPFNVSAFAAAVSSPPAISDAIEEEPVFDASKVTRIRRR